MDQKFHADDEKIRESRFRDLVHGPRSVIVSYIFKKHFFETSVKSFCQKLQKFNNVVLISLATCNFLFIVGLKLQTKFL
jgi:hypothetical protein